VPPTQFEQQMRYLARNGYRCLTLTEAVFYLRKGRGAPAKSFVVTFDDGYRDVHTNAAPILERFGFTATVFLVASRMDSPSDWAGQEGERAGQLLSWHEARDLARRGFVLGSHTLTHPRLTTLDDASAFAEIRDSKLLLQDRLGMPVDFFSYPYSFTDTRIARLVESAGYAAACAGNSGAWGLFHLWRIPCLKADTPLAFALKAGGLYHTRIVLRESAPGRLLRDSVRTLRRPRPISN
jgi:peptidoglycan/xylan/chitin deacetylase (PgdA/CDA1 family)